LNIEDPRYAKALRHPLRVRILAALQEDEATPTQLAEALGASVGTVAYHVRTLNSLGLIELVGETRVRGAVAHHYRAVPDPELSDGPLGEATSRARNAAGGFSLPGRDLEDDDAHGTRATLKLDAEGWEQLSEACSQLLEAADRIAESSAKRLARDPQADDRDVNMVVMMFDAEKARSGA
jgi:DNA-binding transcriptional ArsR family regulator